MQHIERYLIHVGPAGVTIRMRQGRQALIVGLTSLAVLAASWWFGPYGPQPSRLWTPPENFYLIWCSFFAIVSLGCIIGFFYCQDATITPQQMVLSSTLGLFRRTAPIPRPRKLRINALSMGTSTGRPVFPFRVLFLDGRGRTAEFSLEFQSSSSVDRFLRAVQPALTLEVEDSRKADGSLHHNF